MPYSRIFDYLQALILIIIATVAGFVMHNFVVATNLVMLYLLTVVMVAIRLGYGPAIFTASLSVLVFNFFFVPPQYTLRVADAQYLLTFMGLFVVGFVIADLTNRSRKQSEATQQAQIAKEREKLQTALLNSISHELRTPLVSITGTLGTLRDPNVVYDNDAQKELIEGAWQEAERLNHLVGNLLEMSRLQAGNTRIRRELYDIHEVIAVARRQLVGRLNDRHLITDIQPDVPLIPIDLMLMALVISNLLDNAIKYSPPQSKIVIQVSYDKAWLTLAVYDEGMGIAEADIPHIFERFYRSDSVNEIRGTGLGLSICESIVELHGGQIKASNRTTGGACFEITLPLQAILEETVYHG